MEAWRKEKITSLSENLKASLDENDWTKVNEFSAELELLVSTTGSWFKGRSSWDGAGIEDPEVYICLHFISLFFKGQLPEAKFLWKRIPDSFGPKKDPNSNVSRCWKLGKHLWNRELSLFYETGLAGPWVDLVQKGINALINHVRSQNHTLLVKAYSTVSLETFALQVGFSREAAEEFAVKKGWTVEKSEDMMDCSADGKTKFLKPSKTLKDEVSKKNHRVEAEDLGRLTRFVSFLDSKIS
mmetsp:Transcript_4659/g.5378  ORF Transcript_4659/g.5378 Transcript_4659/m.5378 type:complete len:241 (+) Transcript_4659:149-871(+)